MNKSRRTVICTLIEQLEILIEDEREAFESSPDSIQYSERGETMEENVDKLEEARDLLESID